MFMLLADCKLPVSVAVLGSLFGISLLVNGIFSLIFINGIRRYLYKIIEPCSGPTWSVDEFPEV